MYNTYVIGYLHEKSRIKRTSMKGRVAMGLFSGIIDAAKRKAEEKKKEMASAREMAELMDVNQLIITINNNPAHFSISRLFVFSEELKKRMDKVSDSQLKLAFNDASRKNNIMAIQVYGSELENRGYANKENGYYVKIGRW